MPKAGVAIMQDIDAMLDFFLYEKGKSVKLNGTDQTALVIDAVDKLAYYDDKIIRCKYNIRTGDFIEYNNSKYLIISQIDKSESSYRARIRKCNAGIAFNWIGNIKWFDSIDESNVFDITSDKYMSLPTGNINVFVQNNTDTRNVAIDQRFYVTNQPFKITGIDKSQEGLIKFNCDLDTISTTYDDVENNIVDRWRYETSHTYSLTIDNGDTANVQINNTAQIICTVTDNNNNVQNPAITFSSSDSNYVSVDNSGQLMGINPGQAVITAKLTYHDSVQDTISVTCVETVSHSYSITITGETSIMTGSSKSYVAHIFDNGTEVYDKSASWTIRNQDNSTPVRAVISGSTGNSATVQAGSQSGQNVVLKATLIDDSNVYTEFTIQIKGLW